MRTFNGILAASALAFLSIPVLATAQSEGDVRLSDGAGGRSGRLEIFHAGQWGTVCDDFFGNLSAEVTCRQLGFNSGIEAPFNFYGQGVDPIWMDNVQCNGTEPSLASCPHNGYGNHNCVHLEDVGVHCSGCPASPAACTGGFGKATLLIKESVPGKEKLVVKMVKGPALTAQDLGDPLNFFFENDYSLCVYDDAGTLVGEMDALGTGDLCGSKPCWKQIGSPTSQKGYVFKDTSASQDGLFAMTLKAGLPGKSKIIVKGKNAPNLPGSSLPSVAPSLAGSTSATVQLFSDQSECFSATLDDVKASTPTFFKATN